MSKICNIIKNMTIVFYPPFVNVYFNNNVLFNVATIIYMLKSLDIKFKNLYLNTYDLPELSRL